MRQNPSSQQNFKLGQWMMQFVLLHKFRTILGGGLLNPSSCNKWSDYLEKFRCKWATFAQMNDHEGILKYVGKKHYTSWNYQGALKYIGKKHFMKINLLISPAKSVNFGTNLITFRGSILWNNLPLRLKNSQTIDGLKFELKNLGKIHCTCTMCSQ